MPIDIVYPVRPGGRNVELKYSLRSLDNLPHNDVWIVGNVPNWVTNVWGIQLDQRKGKYRNSLTNLLTAAQTEELSDEFYYFNDDFYVTEKVEGELPALNRGPLIKVIGWMQENNIKSKYYRRILNTYQFLVASGFPNPTSYELHAPMKMDKEGVLEVFDDIGWDSPDYIPVQPRTIYGNYNNVGGTSIADVKVHGKSAKEFDNKSGNGFLSSNDKSFENGHIGRTIQRQFPKRCQYERSVKQVKNIRQPSTMR